MKAISFDEALSALIEERKKSGLPDQYSNETKVLEDYERAHGRKRVTDGIAGKLSGSLQQLSGQSGRRRGVDDKLGNVTE